MNTMKASQPNCCYICALKGGLSISELKVFHFKNNCSNFLGMGIQNNSQCLI